MAKDIWRLGAVKTAQRIAKGKLSAVEVTEAHLARMEAVNGKLNAVTVPLAESALKAAKAADKARKKGEELGPLHGVPVTIKENVDVTGQATPNGVEGLEGVIAPDDSPITANLAKAGAITIGRTNTPEFSLRWHTDNKLRGATLNPFGQGITPGGSSGGAAASLAAGIGCIAHGNDLGGSLRYPAYCCGLATIRPTLGRVPAFNPSQAEERPPVMLLMSVQGPIARSVADVRLGLAVMAGRDMRDPWWVPAPLNLPAPKKRKVALVTEGLGGPVQPAVADAIRKAGKILSKAGYKVEEVAPPELDHCREVWGTLLMAETRAIMGKAIREYGSEDINRSLDFMLAAFPEVDLEGYMRAIGERNRLLRDWLLFLEDFPLIVGPVSNELPFAPNDDISSQERAHELYRAQTLMVAINMLGLPSAAVATGLADGVPTGVQIVGSRYREDLCLDAAQAIEDEVGELTPIDPVF